MKSGFYKTISDDQFSSWTKKFQSTSESQTSTTHTHTHTHTQKGHDHCLVVCWQSDPLQLSESQWNHYMWEVCSVNWWDALKAARPAASSGQQNGPNSSPLQCLTTRRTTDASKVEGIGLQCFASTAIFT